MPHRAEVLNLQPLAENKKDARMEGKLVEWTDLEESILQAEKKGRLGGTRDILEAFVDEEGNFLVLSRDQLVKRVVAQGKSRFKASTLSSEKFPMAIGRLVSAKLAPLTIKESQEPVGENGRAVTVYCLVYRTASSNQV